MRWLALCVAWACTVGGQRLLIIIPLWGPVGGLHSGCTVGVAWACTAPDNSPVPTSVGAGPAGCVRTRAGSRDRRAGEQNDVEGVGGGGGIVRSRGVDGDWPVCDRTLRTSAPQRCSAACRAEPILLWALIGPGRCAC
jgi:hypothetical protein